MSKSSSYIEKFCIEWFSFIKKNTDKDWDWNFLSIHPYVTMNIIRNNPKLPWNKDYVPHNPNFRWNDIEYSLLRSPDDIFDNTYADYSTFSVINIESDTETFKYKGYYDGNYNISYSPDFCWNKVKADPKYPWRWDIISRNVNCVTKQWKKYLKYSVTWNIIEKYTNNDIADIIVSKL